MGKMATAWQVHALTVSLVPRAYYKAVAVGFGVVRFAVCT